MLGKSTTNPQDRSMDKSGSSEEEKSKLTALEAKNQSQAELRNAKEASDQSQEKAIEAAHALMEGIAKDAESTKDTLKSNMQKGYREGEEFGQEKKKKTMERAAAIKDDVFQASLRAEEAIKETIHNVATAIKDTIQEKSWAAKETVGNKTEETKESVKNMAKTMDETLRDKAEEIKASASDMSKSIGESTTDKAKEISEVAKHKAEIASEVTKDKAEQTKGSAGDMARTIEETAKDKANETSDAVKAKAEEISQETKGTTDQVKNLMKETTQGDSETKQTSGHQTRGTGTGIYGGLGSAVDRLRGLQHQASDTPEKPLPPPTQQQQQPSEGGGVTGTMKHVSEMAQDSIHAAVALTENVWHKTGETIAEATHTVKDRAISLAEYVAEMPHMASEMAGKGIGVIHGSTVKDTAATPESTNKPTTELQTTTTETTSTVPNVEELKTEYLDLSPTSKPTVATADYLPSKKDNTPLESPSNIKVGLAQRNNEMPEE